MPSDARNVSQSSNEAPHSRLFVISTKSLNEDDFRRAFEPFGTIADIFVVKDKISGENKGVTYIQFEKTSDAAKALEAMHGKSLGAGRPLKVMIASKPEEGKKEVDFEELSHRLFVVVPKTMTDDELYEAFKEFGHIVYARIVKDRNTKESKGVAYVKFSKFSEAAEAFENCDKSYKAVFAKPRKPAEPKESFNDNNGGFSGSFGFIDDPPQRRFGQKRNYPDFSDPLDMPAASGYGGEEFNKLFCIANPILTQDQLWSLFDLVPSMDFCEVQYEGERALVEVIYKNSRWAAYAKDKLNGFEYPPGSHLVVRSEFDEHSRRPQEGSRQDILRLAECLVESTKSGRTPNLSEILQPFLDRAGPSERRSHGDGLSLNELPKIKPMSKEAEVKARCFIVCHPRPLHSMVLKDLFCRFGNLVDVYLVKNKNYGYATYGSEQSAQNAMRVLHGFEHQGAKLKVVEAEDKPEDKKMKTDFY